MSEAPQVTRVRHDIRRRRLTVARVERLAPRMLRVVLGGDELSGFRSLGFDDHVKLFFAADAQGGSTMRDYTPRRYDTEAGELWIDFYLHEAGPATEWALQAAPGQTLDVAGPRGSSIIPIEGIAMHGLIGDETALPAIARRLEELPPQSRALVILDTEPGAHDYHLESHAAFEVVRLPRTGPAAPAAERFTDALRTLAYPRQSCFTWLAAESQVARAVRRQLTLEFGIDKRWIKASGYWRLGTVGTHDKIGDED